MSFDIGGNAGNSFPFEQTGDSVTGQIQSLEEIQQTDMNTGEPAFWDTPRNTQPKMQYRVVLETDLRDDDADDGKRAVYLKGSRKPESKSSLAAVLGAVRAATGGTSLDPGAHLTLTYVGDGVPSTRGFNPPKLYEARYQAAPMNLAQPAQQPTQAPQQQSPADIPGNWPAQQQSPAQQPQTLPQPTQQQGPSAEQIAALRAAGIDPATVFPNVA